MEFNNTELIGYLAMVSLIISFSFRDVNKLRIVNTFACTCFVVYGMLLKAYPVAISNFIIIVINIVQLVRGNSKKDS
ncbi:YgjV family protein [Aureibacter tunicatorum]|uniref:Uncharacterized protein with PQ loop repeat n=1 Tax=Aureibacter tunicatorum TaxID=866807 RepID=A0AAE3XK83_9BACT|nr:YgjV family protein [Aureibacter tunicatorum]MDR6237518.1 uncharacterized protein with PQ loop repeat [Aureibacter tunicatorum]BDD02552.1 hypothetical protein AUTU_00350 [Aureibacter tunicatorum]